MDGDRKLETQKRGNQVNKQIFVKKKKSKCAKKNWLMHNMSIDIVIEQYLIRK